MQRKQNLHERLQEQTRILHTQAHALPFFKALFSHNLVKPEPLTAEEWEIMRQRPEKGYRIAQATTDLVGIADLILRHHEWWDGRGYPLGLAGEDIPIECRILAIVDSFDAMTNDRPYRKAMPAEEALAELEKCAGTQFDPQLVEAFLEIMSSEEK